MMLNKEPKIKKLIVTHIDETMVIYIPGFTISAIVKYPAVYGITIVGVDVTSIKESDDVNPAGIATRAGSIPIVPAKAISNGTIMIPVTVLLENITFIMETPRTTAKIIITGCKRLRFLNSTHASHLAAPVLYIVVPSANPETINTIAPQLIECSTLCQLNGANGGKTIQQCNCYSYK